MSESMSHAALSALSQKQQQDELLLDKEKLKELCAEICGDRDALDDKVATSLSWLAEEMVDNIVDFSCMYAKHRNSDTLEKQDIAFAVQKLYPDIAKEPKEKDIQVLIDQ